jgi:hypothetical protein
MDAFTTLCFRVLRAMEAGGGDTAGGDGAGATGGTCCLRCPEDGRAVAGCCGTMAEAAASGLRDVCGAAPLVTGFATGTSELRVELEAA